MGHADARALVLAQGSRTPLRIKKCSDPAHMGGGLSGVCAHMGEPGCDICAGGARTQSGSGRRLGASRGACGLLFFFGTFHFFLYPAFVTPMCAPTPNTYPLVRAGPPPRIPLAMRAPTPAPCPFVRTHPCTGSPRGCTCAPPGSARYGGCTCALLYGGAHVRP